MRHEQEIVLHYSLSLNTSAYSGYSQQYKLIFGVSDSQESSPQFWTDDNKQKVVLLLPPDAHILQAKKNQ